MTQRQQQPITIVIVHDQRSEREKLKGLLTGVGGRCIQVIGEARNGKECIALVTRLCPNIVLMKQGLPDISGMETAATIGADHPEAGVILILASEEREKISHNMLQSGIKEFVTFPINADQLLERVLTVAGMRFVPVLTELEPATVKRRIITVTGPRGGCGKTVVATNLAVILARDGDKVALVDFNLRGGDIAILLDLQPKRTLGDFLPGFGGIDYDAIDGVMVKHSSGASVLAAPLTGDFDGAALSRSVVQSILGALREHFQCTIVDTGYTSLESTLAAMDYSDLILVVVGTDLPRLRNANVYLKNLVAATSPREKIRVVVNRTTGPKGISLREVESILEFPVIAQIPNDGRLVGSSINLGQPFAITHPRRPLSLGLAALAESLSPNAVAVKNRTPAPLSKLIPHLLTRFSSAGE